MKPLFAAALACLAAAPAAAAQPVVVELFTSQACSSCPPADAFLEELKGTDADLLPLDFHVNYWDGTGWKDPYSSQAATQRQWDYAADFGQKEVYTPQMVIGGVRQAVGSDRRAVLAGIAELRSRQAVSVPLQVATRDRTLTIEAGAGSGTGTLWLVGFDDHHATAVRRGENGGRTLSEVNVVRSLRKIGAWHGVPLSLDVPAPAGERSAVLLQAEGGRILAAAKVPPSDQPVR